MSRSFYYLLYCLIPVGAFAAPPANPPANPPMKVEVQNFPDVQDVRIEPRRGYMLKISGPAVTIPFTSYLQGALLSTEAFGICRTRLSYVDQSTRPGGANSNDIATVGLGGGGTSASSVLGSSIYVPLPSILVAEGTALTFNLGAGCVGDATLYLVPRETGVGGPGGIGF